MLLCCSHRPQVTRNLEMPSSGCTLPGLYKEGCIRSCNKFAKATYHEKRVTKQPWSDFINHEGILSFTLKRSAGNCLSYGQEKCLQPKVLRHDLRLLQQHWLRENVRQYLQSHFSGVGATVLPATDGQRVFRAAEAFPVLCTSTNMPGERTGNWA